MPLKALNPHVLVRKYQKPQKSRTLLLTTTKMHYTLTICEVVDVDTPQQDQLTPGDLVVVDSSALKYSIEEQAAENYFIHVDAIFGHYTIPNNTNEEGL